MSIRSHFEMLLVYNHTDSATWNASSSTRNEQLILLRENCKKNHGKKMLIVIQIPRIICPRKRSIHIPVPSPASRKRRSSVILHGFEKHKKQNKKSEKFPGEYRVHIAAPANSMYNAMYSFYTGNRFAHSDWAREQTHTKPWKETAAFSFLSLKNQNAQNMQGEERS